MVASFPGLPRLQFLILQAIKNWSRGRPGNEAISMVHSAVFFYTDSKLARCRSISHFPFLLLE